MEYKIIIGNVDYVALSSTITISRNSMVGMSLAPNSCVRITVIGNDLKEGRKVFHVVFTPLLQDKFLGSSNVTVFIPNDGDGMYINV